MNYNETLQYLYKALPMFHRMGAAAYKPDLGNTIELCRLAGNPHQYIKCIHVAGTNGKGSVSHMLASVLQEAGYTTGLYTSPHLKDFRERIRINGALISRKYITDFVEKYSKQFSKIKPSFFEMTVMLAFSYFNDKKVDVAVIETGLGGRLDSTNIITPLISVITNVGWDHMNLLGDSLQLIAHEKAGIIKKHVPAVLGEAKSATRQIFIDTAARQQAPLYIASQNYKAETDPEQKSKNTLGVIIKRKGKFFTRLKLDLTGLYQLKNVVTVLQAIEVLQEHFKMPDVAVLKGLSRVQINTGLQGRWQTLNKKPLIIADTGHNTDGLKEVLKMLKTINYDQLHFVFGMVNDKALDEILKLLPRNAIYYFCKANIPRGLATDILQDAGLKHQLHGNIYSSVTAALNAAKKAAKAKDLIFVGGSTFTVAEVV